MPDKNFIKYLHAIALKWQKLCQQYIKAFSDSAIYATKDERRFYSILEMDHIEQRQTFSIEIYFSKYYYLTPHFLHDICLCDPLKVSKM